MRRTNVNSTFDVCSIHAYLLAIPSRLPSPIKQRFAQTQNLRSSLRTFKGSPECC
jgi:hypothetical protein